MPNHSSIELHPKKCSTEQPLATVPADAPWLSNAGLFAGAFGLEAAVGELGLAVSSRAEESWQ